MVPTKTSKMYRFPRLNGNVKKISLIIKILSHMTNLNHSPKMARAKHSTVLEENQLAS